MNFDMNYTKAKTPAEPVQYAASLEDGTLFEGLYSGHLYMKVGRYALSLTTGQTHEAGSARSKPLPVGTTVTFTVTSTDTSTKSNT